MSFHQVAMPPPPPPLLRPHCSKPVTSTYRYSDRRREDHSRSMWAEISKFPLTAHTSFCKTVTPTPAHRSRSRDFPLPLHRIFNAPLQLRSHALLFRARVRIETAMYCYILTYRQTYSEMRENIITRTYIARFLCWLWQNVMWVMELFCWFVAKTWKRKEYSISLIEYWQIVSIYITTQTGYPLPIRGNSHRAQQLLVTGAYFWHVFCLVWFACPCMSVYSACFRWIAYILYFI